MAAHTGPGAVVLWILAALLFAVPLAVTVAALTVKYKGVAGGFYVWTRRDFGPWHAFLCFWIYWTGLAFWLPGAALFYMSAGFRAVSRLGRPGQQPVRDLVGWRWRPSGSRWEPTWWG